MRKLVFDWLIVFTTLIWAPAVFGASGDLVIDTDSIAFSDTSPMEGDAIAITALVRNQGDGDISEDIEVRFVEGEPGKGGLQIAYDAVVLGLKAGATGTVNVKWRAAPGKTKVYVIADPDNLVKEAREDNNTAVKSIKGREWKGPKVTDEQIKESIKKGLDWLRTQQGEFYVTCPNGHDNFLYAALAYGKCVICQASLKGIEPARVRDRMLFSLGLEFQSHLSNDKVPESLQKQFENNNIWLSSDAVISVKEKDKEWLITDEGNNQIFSVRKQNDKLNVYYEETMPGGWMAEIGPGMTSLVLMTFLQAGVDESDPTIQRGLHHLFNDAPVKWKEWTDAYEHAAGILALTATGNKEKYMDWVEFSTQRLEALQTPDGGWGYGTQVPDAAHLQYVIMALYAAKQWGVQIKPETWSKAAVWLTGMQQPDGGWNYYSGRSGPFAEDSYGSMTATAVMGLKAAGISPSSESVRRGMEWLEKYYSVTRNPGSFYWHYYYLVALQRAMDIPPSHEKLGGHDWYAEIASFLISKQQADGGWIAATPIYTTGPVDQAPTIADWGADRGDIMATSFAVLFLTRAMPKSALPDVGLGPQPITLSKAEPSDGEEVTITASVSNAGAISVENVEVSFYDGDPESGGVPIGIAQTLPSLSGAETGEISIVWKAAGTGEHKIYVVVDPSNSIQESNEENNIAYEQIKVGGESRPAIPAMVEIEDGVYKLGNIDLNLKRKTVTMYGKVNMSYGLIELLACTKIGKVHESALVMDVEPIHLQTALILLGLEHEGGLRYQGDPRTPKGDRVRIWVEWDSDDGEPQRHRAEDLVFNRVTQNSMKHTDWVFSGSRINNNGVFMAQAVGTLITTFHDPDAIIDNPLPEGGDDTVYIVNTQIAPPKGTSVRMVITPAEPS